MVETLIKLSRAYSTLLFPTFKIYGNFYFKLQMYLTYVHTSLRDIILVSS